MTYPPVQAHAHPAAGPLAIVVQVPQAEDTCFLAIPYRTEFKELAARVGDAAAGLELLINRADQVQRDANFVRNLTARIRAAKVVVVVLSPESGRDQPNPNVLYELGLAHSLGKPVVMLTDQPESIPADLSGLYYLQYTEEEVVSGALVYRISQAIGQRTHNLQSVLTEPGWEGISVARAQHTMLLAPRLWDGFRSILSFAKEVHDQIQAIDAGHMDVLLRSVDILNKEGTQQQNVGDLIAKWRLYELYYTAITEPQLFQRLDEKLQAIDSCFQDLMQGADERWQRAIPIAQQFYRQIATLLRSYLKHHQEIIKDVERLADLPAEPRDSIRLLRDIQNLSHTTKTCIIQADRLVVNLIEMML